MTVADIRDSVVKGRSREVESRIREALSAGIDPRVIVEEGLMPAMDQVGREALTIAESDIARLLCAARGVRIGMDILEPLLRSSGTQAHRGKVILGTVRGDLHDLGKNLVGVMYRSVGFDVVDLGVDISGERFVKALRENPDASIVGLSVLLTTALPELKRTVTAIRRADKEHRLKIMVGGGAVTQAFAESIGADAYTETAVDAALIARTMIASHPEEGQVNAHETE